MSHVIIGYVTERPRRSLTGQPAPEARPPLRRAWMVLALALLGLVLALLAVLAVPYAMYASRRSPNPSMQAGSLAPSAGSGRVASENLQAAQAGGGIFPASPNLLTDPGFVGGSAAASGGQQAWAPIAPFGRSIEPGGRSGSALIVDRTTAAANVGDISGGGAAQTVQLSPPSSKPLYFGAFSSLQAYSRLRSSPAPSDYCVRLDVAYEDGSSGSMVLPFSTGNHGWEQQAAYFWPAYVYMQPGQAKAVRSATISLVFAKTLAGVAAFDDVWLQVADAAPPAHAPAMGGTKLLLYSAINPAWAAGTAAQWRARGFGGFIFDHGSALAVDDPYALADVTAFRSMIGRLSAAGITDNFLTISIGDRTPPPSNFGDVFNDAAWSAVTDGLGRFARYARATGLVGVVLDCEPYGASDFLRDPGNGLHTKKLLGDTVYARGQQVASAIDAEFPDAVIMLLPQLSDQPNYEFYLHFFSGLASVAGAQNIVVGDEREYSMWQKDPALDALSWARGVEDSFARKADVPDWDVDTNLAIGMFPLGYYRQLPSAQDQRWYYAGKAEIFGDAKLPPGDTSLRGGSYYDKSSYGYLTADQYFGQLAAYRQAFPRARYIWIYGHGGALYQLTDPRYGPQGTIPPQLQPDGRTPLAWVYRNASRFRFGEQPTDPFIDYFFWDTAYWFGG